MITDNIQESSREQVENAMKTAADLYCRMCGRLGDGSITLKSFILSDSSVQIKASAGSMPVWQMTFNRNKNSVYYENATLEFLQSDNEKVSKYAKKMITLNICKKLSSFSDIKLFGDDNESGLFKERKAMVGESIQEECMSDSDLCLRFMNDRTFATKEFLKAFTIGNVNDLIKRIADGVKILRERNSGVCIDDVTATIVSWYLVIEVPAVDNYIDRTAVWNGIYRQLHEFKQPRNEKDLQNWRKGCVALARKELVPIINGIIPFSLVT